MGQMLFAFDLNDPNYQQQLAAFRDLYATQLSMLGLTMVEFPVGAPFQVAVQGDDPAILQLYMNSEIHKFERY